MNPFALTPNNLGRVTAVIDASLSASESETIYAIHANNNTTTAFLSGSDIASYLSSLESAAAGETKLQTVDFTVAAPSTSGTAAPAVSAPAAKAGTGGGAAEKEDAKIEGAVQIAIGVKKEVDFSEWYTSVLLKSGMLEYYSVSGCYILRPWSFSVWEEIQSSSHFLLEL